MHSSGSSLRRLELRLASECSDQPQSTPPSPQQLLPPIRPFILQSTTSTLAAASRARPPRTHSSRAGSRRRAASAARSRCSLASARPRSLCSTLGGRSARCRRSASVRAHGWEGAGSRLFMRCPALLVALLTVCSKPGSCSHTLLHLQQPPPASPAAQRCPALTANCSTRCERRRWRWRWRHQRRHRHGRGCGASTDTGACPFLGAAGAFA